MRCNQCGFKVRTKNHDAGIHHQKNRYEIIEKRIEKSKKKKRPQPNI